MTYKEALNHMLTVKWKTSECITENCWCRTIEPIDKIEDDECNEIYVVAAGAIDKDTAEHIVKIHNEHIDRKDLK